MDVAVEVKVPPTIVRTYFCPVEVSTMVIDCVTIVAAFTLSALTITGFTFRLLGFPDTGRGAPG